MFIDLTLLDDGKGVSVNINKIIAFWRDEDEGSVVWLQGAAQLKVVQSPATVEALIRLRKDPDRE